MQQLKKWLMIIISNNYDLVYTRLLIIILLIIALDASKILCGLQFTIFKTTKDKSRFNMELSFV